MPKLPGPTRAAGPDSPHARLSDSTHVWPPPPSGVGTITDEETIGPVRLVRTGHVLQLVPIGMRRLHLWMAFPPGVLLLLLIGSCCWLALKAWPIIAVWGLRRTVLALPLSLRQDLVLLPVIGVEMLWVCLLSWKRSREMLYTLDAAQDAFLDRAKFLCPLEQVAIRIRTYRHFYRPSKALYSVSFMMPPSRFLPLTPRGRPVGQFRDAGDAERLVRQMTELADLKIVRVGK